MRQPMRKQRMNLLPVIASLLVLGLVIGVAYFIPSNLWLSTPVADKLCQTTITGKLILDRDIYCPTPGPGQTEGSAYQTAAFRLASGSTLDCQQHKITGTAGIGIEVADSNNVTVQNCNFAGFDVGLSAHNVNGLTVTKSDFQVVRGGIECAQCRKVQVNQTNIAGQGAMAVWGMEFTGGQDIHLSKNHIQLFLNGGINFYGSSNLEVTESVIERIRDTGIGFFGKEGFPPVTKALIAKNQIRQIEKVGALEVMHGTRELVVEKNQIADTHSALHIYEKGEYGLIENVRFVDNTVERSYWPFTLHNCQKIEISGNQVQLSGIGGLATLQDAHEITMTGNLFRLTRGPVVIDKNCNDVMLKNNRYEDPFGKFFQMNYPAKGINLTENDWGVCPERSAFDGIKYPQELNPILIKKESERVPYTLQDQNKDGKDDNGCK